MDHSDPDPPTPEDYLRSIDLNQLTLPGKVPQEFTADDLDELNYISEGAFGQVFHTKHRKTGTVIAVKKIKILMDPHKVEETEHRVKRLKAEIKAIQTGANCRYIVQYYGALLHETDCWICMELMDSSLQKLYKTAYQKGEKMPEEIIGFCAMSVLNALNHLKSTLSIIHRDVKPANILVDKQGNIKLCDFGIAGILINSLVMSFVGTMIYIAPERFGVPANTPYDVRSDVWSLGITLLEIAIGHIPYDFGPKPKIFGVQRLIKDSPAPTLPDKNAYSDDFNHFLKLCLQKEVEHRPKYGPLMQERFYKAHAQRDNALQTVADFVKRVL